jgi:hypothetical protein
MNEGTRSGKSTIRLLGINAVRPTNGLRNSLFRLLFIQSISFVIHKVYTRLSRNWNYVVILASPLVTDLGILFIILSIYITLRYESQS